MSVIVCHRRGGRFCTSVKAGEPNVLKELGHCGGQLSVVMVVVMVVGGNLVTVEVEDGVK